MRVYFAVAAIASSIILSDSAAAQVRGTPPGASAQFGAVNSAAVAERSRMQRGGALDNAERFNRRDASENNREGQTREQRRRARRLAEMANNGQCAEAIRIAWDEGDRDMAERLYDACRNDRVATQPQ